LNGNANQTCNINTKYFKYHTCTVHTGKLFSNEIAVEKFKSHSENERCFPPSNEQEVIVNLLYSCLLSTWTSCE
jgi:hypothetical protein